MKHFKRALAIFFLGISLQQAYAQFTSADIEYWVGIGSDSSILVVDFKDGSWDSTYAWGFLHNGTATGQDMLTSVAAADINFSVAIAGGFLNDITYGSHSGFGGTGGSFWGTWSGTDISNLSMNAGIGTGLANGDIFACSFTDFNPALAPGGPIPAYEPFRFTAQDVNYWVGSGNDSAVLVIDFLDGSGMSALAWGYLFSGSTTGEDMLNAIAADDLNMTVAIAGGFLNDITYGSMAGIGGNPDFWGTWSATNLGNWDLNMGISSPLQNGDFFACSYTDFAPAVRPGYPSAATNPSISTQIAIKQALQIYPNPANDFIRLHIDHLANAPVDILIIDANGRVVSSSEISSLQTPIAIDQLAPGLYTVQIKHNEGQYIERLIIQ